MPTDNSIVEQLPADLDYLHFKLLYVPEENILEKLRNKPKEH